MDTVRTIPHNSARESDERICVRKRWKTAGILCVFQGFPNAFLAERIRQNPKAQLCGVALDSHRRLLRGISCLGVNDMGERMPGQRNSMFYGAMLLTAGSIGLRLVQLAFQVYISGVMGAAGLGRMQLIMTVGGFAAILASGGVRIAVTCLAAQEAGRDHPEGVRAAVRCCAVYGGVLSSVVGLLLWCLSGAIAEGWIEDMQAALPLRIFAAFLPVTVLWSVLAGYYTAAGRITELVGLEFFERLSSIALVVAGIQLEPEGLDPCTVIFLGSSAATLLSFLLLLRRYLKTVQGIPASGCGTMMRRLLRLTIPLGCNDMLRSGLSAVENLLVPKGLKMGGRDGEKAIAEYGTVCGMVFPVITFPSVILYSISDLLVPEMARCQAKGRMERVRFLADKCLRLTLFLAGAAAGLGLGLGEQLGALLFQSGEAGAYICMFSLLVLMLYPDAITDGMLKGLGQQLHSVRYNTVTSLLDVGLLALLLPRYGMGGFLCAFTVSHGVNFFLSLRRLMVVTGYLPRFYATAKAAAAGTAGWLLLRWLEPESAVLPVLGAAAAYLAVYVGLLLITGALSRDDFRWLWGMIGKYAA